MHYICNVRANFRKMRQLKIFQSITNRESDSLERYLQEIGHEEMVSTEEEVELAQRIRKGDEKALDKLTRANLRFVVSVAKQYQGQGLSLTDLINEGNLGLITAARRFDETRGFKFISYAVWWIRQSILQALAEQSRIVRLPANQVGTLGKVNRFYNQFLQENERRPTVEEISEALDLEPEKVKSAIETSTRHVSMDAPLQEDEQSCMLDLLSSKDNPAISDQLVYESLSNELEACLSSLPERERRIVKMFYGIGEPEKGLDEIGAALHLSRERVRQIKEKAIRQLREDKNNTILRSYLG